MLTGWRPLSVCSGSWPRMVPWGLKFYLRAMENTRNIADAMSLLCSSSIDLYRKHLNGAGHGLVKDTLYLHSRNEKMQL